MNHPGTAKYHSSPVLLNATISLIQGEYTIEIMLHSPNSLIVVWNVNKENSLFGVFSGTDIFRDRRQLQPLVPVSTFAEYKYRRC